MLKHPEGHSFPMAGLIWGFYAHTVGGRRGWDDIEDNRMSSLLVNISWWHSVLSMTVWLAKVTCKNVTLFCNADMHIWNVINPCLMSNDSKLLCFVLFVCFVLFSGAHMSDCGYVMMQRVCFCFVLFFSQNYTCLNKSLQMSISLRHIYGIIVWWCYKHNTNLIKSELHAEQM